MKTLLFLFCAFVASAQDTVKIDTISFKPKPEQLTTLRQVEEQIQALQKQWLDMVIFLFGERIDPKTLVWDGEKFIAKRSK